MPLVCPAALGIAAGSSLLRVVADRHWTTDIIAGALVGSAVGAVVSAVHLRAAVRRTRRASPCGRRGAVDDLLEALLAARCVQRTFP